MITPTSTTEHFPFCMAWTALWFLCWPWDAKGTVSGIAGVFPEPLVATYAAYCDGDIELAKKHQKTCVKFVDALRGGSNMSYFKEALKMRGISAGHMRKPQLDLPAEEVVLLQKQLEGLCAEADISMKL